jgi:hypothetical protein
MRRGREDAVPVLPIRVRGRADPGISRNQTTHCVAGTLLPAPEVRSGWKPDTQGDLAGRSLCDTLLRSNSVSTAGELAVDQPYHEVVVPDLPRGADSPSRPSFTKPH